MNDTLGGVCDYCNADEGRCWDDCPTVKMKQQSDEIERLREALKIFAIYADYLDENYGDHPDHYVSKGFAGHIITFGDFRKARSALKQEEAV